MSILKVGMYASQLTAGHGDKNYLTFSSDAPFSIKFNQKRWDGVLEYSLDAQNWYEWDASEINSVDNALYLRGLGNTVITNGTDAAHAMTMTGSNISSTGNIMTLLDHASPETAVMGARCFSYMFRGCTNLTTAPELPATALAESCYRGMFEGCTGLTTAPELPAATLADNCYRAMFWDCTNLTTAPELPAATLAAYCYYAMFYGCTNLTTAPELPVTALAAYCYYAMFYGCTNLTTAPELPAATLADNCYREMFRDCTNLTTAPELPATTSAVYCYASMFYGCTNLTTAPELPATALAEFCYYAMFRGCTNIRISSTQTGIYQKPWRIPTAGTGTTTSSSWGTNMLYGTGGTFKSTPVINTTYYQAEQDMKLTTLKPRD